MIRIIKRVFIATAIIIAGVLCFKYWRYIWPVVTGIVGLLFISQGGTSEQEKKLQKIQEKEKEIDQTASERRQQAETLVREDEKQQEAIEDWRERKNRWKSRIGLMLILCMLLVVARPAWAGPSYANLTQEELIERLIEAENLLDEADQLLAHETALKEEYRRLYLEAEENLRTARELSRQKDDIITALSRSNQTWGLVGRAEIGQKIGWQLGVVKKSRNMSFGAGIGGGDAFSVWGEVGLWIR